MLNDIAWGTAPDWLAAIGTVGALGVALVLLHHEMEARRRTEDLERRHQARSVAAWITLEDIQDGSGRWMLRISNASEAPIYSVVASAYARPRDKQGEVHGIPTLGPGEPFSKALSHERDWKSVASAVALYFTDSAGRHWQRDVDGTLREMSEAAQLVWAEIG